MQADSVSHRVRKIVSGGQTGVDRGALDAAIALGIEHGGWCPRGRLAEDGVIPSRYQLTETASFEYWVRTQQNVIDSDGTLILYRDAMSGGTELTYRMTLKHGKPCLRVDLNGHLDLASARRWLSENAIQELNVAGPRDSTAPGIADEAREYVTSLLSITGEQQ
jgi:hypothetical protein